ncbi:MAG: MMPL family transporter [Verrucomicrobia bacterium]|nr:MMPL family transporter [Verrucomicrobiota bacterium]
MPSFPSADIERSGLLVDELLQKMAKIEDAFGEHAVRIAVIGGHRIGLDNSRLIRRDTALAIGVAVVAMFLLSFVAYRRRWLALITLVPPAIAASVAGGVLFFSNTQISAIAVGCGTILLGITIDYAIHVLYHIDNGAHQDRRRMAETIQEIAAPITIGALTTLGAFLVLLFSPVESHRQIGMFAAVGVTTAALASLLVIPFLVPLDRGSSLPPLMMTRLFQSFVDWRSRHTVVLASVIAVVTVLAIVGLSGLRVEGDMAKLNGVTPETAADQDVFWNIWGDAASATTILVTAPEMQSALELNERVADALVPLQKEGRVVSCSSIASICPSLRRQAENRERWQHFWTPARRDALEHDLSGIVPEKGFSLSHVNSSMRVLEAHVDGLRPEDLKDTLLEQIISQRTHWLDDSVSISTMVKLDSPERFGALAKALHEAVPEATLLNRVAFSEQVARLAKRGVTVFALAVACIDMAILYFLLGSFGMVLVTLLPIAVGLLWTAGAMGLLGVPLNTVNFIFVVFIIGVGIDYSLFMVTSETAAFRGRPDRIAATSGSITICALTTICGFGVLAVARHPALHSIGVTAFLGMFFTMLATLLTVPPCARAMLRLIDRRAKG